MLATLPAPLFYPLLVLWSIFFGAPCGAFFKLVAVYENWVATNRYHYILWKKYPQRSYQKYISTIWATRIKGVPVELAGYAREKVMQQHPQEPFPVLRMLATTIFMLCLIPYMIVTGLLQGPVYVFKRELQARQQLQRQL